MSTIKQAYMLVQGSTPIYVDRQGVSWLEKLWAIDAAEHLSAIEDLRIASPVIHVETADPSMVRVDHDERLRRIRFVPLPHARSRPHALRQLPKMLGALWPAIGAAAIVHVGIAGWPYPLGWLAVPMAKWRRKATVVVVESAPWRLAGDRPPSLSARMQAWAYERLGRAIVAACGVRFFTTKAYLDSLCGSIKANAHVIQATWVPQDQVIDDKQLAEQIAARRAAPDAPLKLAFIGRLATEKGISFLVDAFANQPALRTQAQLDIFGEGALLDDLKARLSHSSELSGIRLQGTVAYGPAFFSRLRDYDYVVVPSLSDEQPRIVYDAYSQGVPVLASATDGLRQCVSDGETGILFEPGKESALTSALALLATPGGRQTRERLAKSAVMVARSMTHAAMHLRRGRFLLDFLSSRKS